MTLENKKRVYFITNIHLTLQICLCPSERIKKCKHNYEAKQYKTNIYKEKNKFNKTEKFKKFHLDILHVA